MTTPNINWATFAVELRAQYPGLKLDMFGCRDTGYVIITLLIVPTEQRNSGIGDEVMAAIIAAADQHERSLALTPAADFGGDLQRLVRWYRRLGFIPNAGSSRDYRVSQTMIRPPE
jgi:GNAT superfamily N-acetyltransferase